MNPIELNPTQEQLAKLWASDDRLWTTQEVVEINLRVFARNILKCDTGQQCPPPDDIAQAREEALKDSVIAKPSSIGVLACPFCGSEAAPFKETPTAYWMVYCNYLGCGSCGPGRKERHDAIKAWNTRQANK